MKRIIDANINRASEAARVLEEIARFYIEDKIIAENLKNIRHKICLSMDDKYGFLLKSRDTVNDIGTEIKNPTKRSDIASVFKANIKRLQQSLRTLAEYSQFVNIDCLVFEKLRYETYTTEKIMWEKISMKINKIRLKGKKLYLVTNSDSFKTNDEFLNSVASALDGGVQIIQLREKNSDAKRIIELGKKIRELCSIYNALLIINDRIDIAQIVHADGVHLGQDDIDIKSAREILGENMIIGISTHAPEQAKKAAEEGADYIGVGPIYTTPTKQGVKAVGLEYLKWVSENITIPYFAIGGINLLNCSDVISSGANRIAVVRAIMNSESPKDSAKKFLEKINK